MQEGFSAGPQYNCPLKNLSDPLIGQDIRLFAGDLLNRYLHPPKTIQLLTKQHSGRLVSTEYRVAPRPGWSTPHHGKDWAEHSGLELTNRGQTSGPLRGAGPHGTPCRPKERGGDTRQGQLEREVWFLALVRGIRHRLRKCVEVPLSLRQERWR